jgi:hypothetical protein
MPYTIQGNTVTLGTEPFLHNGKHYVPLRDVIEQLGGSVTFDNDTKTATATIATFNATIQMGDRNIDVSGTPVTLTADPFVEDGQMFVPFDFFHDAYGYEVNLDPNTKAMSIVNPNAA